MIAAWSHRRRYAYGPENAWINMVLVTANWRRRGRDQTGRCLDVATKQGLTCWLDATPAGAGVGRSVSRRRCNCGGCVWKIRLMKGDAPAPLPVASCAIDRARSQRDGVRPQHRWQNSPDARSRLLSRDGALALVRAGRTADHIGPLFADRADHALAMVDAIVRSQTGPLLIDAVSTQDEFLHGLTGSGWQVERPFQRMRFGRATAKPAELPFAVAGPEFG